VAYLPPQFYAKRSKLPPPAEGNSLVTKVQNKMVRLVFRNVEVPVVKSIDEFDDFDVLIFNVMHLRLLCIGLLALSIFG
jgi:hypothetical protein